MTAHTHLTIVPGCYRCELSRDEAESEMWDHVRVAKLLRGQAKRPDRRPGTRALLLDLAEQCDETAAEIREALR